MTVLYIFYVLAYIKHNRDVSLENSEHIAVYKSC